MSDLPTGKFVNTHFSLQVIILGSLRSSSVPQKKIGVQTQSKAYETVKRLGNNELNAELDFRFVLNSHQL